MRSPASSTTILPESPAVEEITGGTNDGATSSSQNTTNKKKLYHHHPRCVEWLLATAVAASIGWVCLFTTLSTHTDPARDSIYDAFATTYFPEKAGARVFTYLVAFYLFPGALTYFALYYWGVRLPRPTYTMVHTYRIPWFFTTWCNHVSLIEIMAVLVFVSVEIATMASRIINRFEMPWWPAERVWYEVSKTLGKLLAFALLILLFPVCKNCFWWDLLNFQFERAVKLHRWIAWSAVWLVLAHVLTALVPLIHVGQFRNCMWPNEACQKPGGWDTYKGLQTSRIYTYGWIAFLFLVPVAITSLPWFRRHKFEWFYYTHFLFIPFLIMLHLHYRDMIYYTAPGLSAYVLDKVVWFLVSRRGSKLVSLTVPAPGFVRITIALDKDHSFLPGQWVQINIPAVSFWEWHPMSVASSPGHSTIAIDVKVLGDWSEKLYHLAKRFDSSKPAHTCIFVDSFHGSSHSEMQGYLNHAAVVMFSGGIGATPMMSALRSVIEQSQTSFPGIRKVVFVWCVRKQSVLELYRSELAEYQSLNKTLASGCELDILVHCTFSEEEDDELAAGDLALDIEPSSTTGGQTLESRRQAEKQGPFMQHAMGYGHKLVLTVFAGCSFLLGIFVANVAAHGNAWRPEALSILQLLLAVLFAAISVAAITSYTLFRPTSQVSHEDQGDGGTDIQSVSNNETSGGSTTTNDLDVVYGCRPNVPEILASMKAYCVKNNIPSVGVSVCGPEMLVDAVIASSNISSSSSVHFVVDEETFDW